MPPCLKSLVWKEGTSRGSRAYTTDPDKIHTNEAERRDRMWSRVASAVGCGLCFGSQAEQFSITVAQSVQLVLVRFVCDKNPPYVSITRRKRPSTRRT